MMKYTLSAAFVSRSTHEPIEADNELQTAFHRQGVTEFQMSKQQITVIALSFTTSPMGHENGEVRPELLTQAQKLIVGQIRRKYGVQKNIKFNLEHG